MNAFYNESPRGSIGMLSVVPTGIQREKSGEFLKFQPSADKSELPDWLLLDLLGPSIWPHTSMNSTLGKVNINATIFPDFGIQRWVPLQGVFQNMPHVGASGAPSLNVGDASPVVKNIINHNLAGQDFGAQGRYDYIGEICEVAGVADTGATDWDKEVLIRNLANILTVRSNTFKVYGVAQTIKKKSTNTNYGEFEPGDMITGEKRFESVVERAVWPGKDGVPGNAHVSAAGTYDSMATQPLPTPSPSPVAVPWAFPSIPKWGNSSSGGLITAGSWAVTDGPDDPTYSPTTLGGDAGGKWANPQHSSSTLEEANNPLRAWMKYRVLSFNYLGDY